MSETIPRELIPESIMTPELPDEPDAVSAVKREKQAHEQAVEESFDAIRNLSPSATKEEISEAMEAHKAAQDRQNSFQEMWADYGGQAVDEAQAAVNEASSDPTSTKYARAIAKLSAAEDAFYSRIQSERDAIYEDAYSEHDAYKAEIESTIAASPALSEMNELALKISRIRNAEPNPRTANRDRIRLEEYEAKLEELLDAYTRSDEFDSKYSDEIMERTVRPVEEKAADVLPADSKLDDDADTSKKPDVLPVDSKLDGDDDGKDKPDVDPKASTLDDEDSEDGKDETDSDTPDVLPKDSKLDDDEDSEEPKPDVLPKDSKLDTEDDEEDKPDVDPKDSKLDDEEDGEGESEPRAKLHKRIGRRLYRMFTYENEDGERKLSGKKLTIATLGLAAVAAAAYFTFRTGSDHSHLVPSGPKGGDTIDAGGLPTPGPEATIPGADLPPSAGFDYPWNWASEAFGAEHAMSGLQDLAAKAVEDGKNVEWHGSGTHQWLEIDGNSNTKHVIDILRQYHK